MSIINSILDTDAYKLTMGQAVWSQYPEVRGKFKFFNRKGTKFPPKFNKTLKMEIRQWPELVLSYPEAEQLKKKMPYLKDAYVEWLRGNPVLDQRYLDELNITLDDEGNLEIEFEGLWRYAIYWEVPLLATISELYYIQTEKKLDRLKAAIIFEEKEIDLACLSSFADFGTRRRFSRFSQNAVVQRLAKAHDLTSAKDFPGFMGTSNVALSISHGIKAIGTVAHEWPMAHQALFGTRMANLEGMRAWQREFGTELGIMLPDTFTSDMFFHSFDGYYARLCDGLRHDSGDPIEFAEKVLKHYHSLGIDSTTKTIVFSDGLTPKKALAIQDWAKGRPIKTSFGIGTNLSNDVGHDPLSIVIKATEFDGVPVVKISDEPGKVTGTEEAVAHTNYVIKTTLNGRRRF